MRKFLFLNCSLAAVCVAGLGIAVPAMAQDEVAEDQYEDDCCPPLPIPLPSESVITVTATGNPITLSRTGQSVAIIDQREILEVQGADLSRILRRVPGVTFSRNGGVGAFSGLRVRGAEAEQTLVFVDGVKLADPAAPAGGFDFGNLTTGNIAKIELLRSSNSTIWGSDAIGGVMVVSTRGTDRVSDRSKRLSYNRAGATGVINAEYGANNTALLSASGSQKTNVASFGAAANFYRSDGFSAAANGSEADGFEQFSITGGGSVRPINRLEIFANARYAEGDLEIDGFPAPTFALADTDEFQKTKQFSAAAGARLNTGNINLQASYSFADTARDNFNPAFGTAPSFTSDGSSDRLALRGEWVTDWPHFLSRVNFGADHEWLEYETLFDAGNKARIFGAYGQLGFNVGELWANVGVRHDDHSRFGGATSFGADAAYDLGSVRLHASIGEGFKAPSLFQLFSDFGNEGLLPEQSTSFDFGASLVGNYYDNASVTFFRRDTENLINFVSCFGSSDPICTNRPFGTYDNVGRTRAQGVEVAARKLIADQLQLRAAYTFTDTENRDRSSVNFGNVLARRPKHAATLSADWEVDHQSVFGPTIGMDARYVSGAFDDAANNVRLDDYFLVDLRLVVPLLWISRGPQRTLDAFARVENVWDEQYQTAAGFGTQGRAAFVGLRASL